MVRDKEKYNAYMREWNRRNPQIRQQRIARKFGLTIENYRDMLEKQNGVCAICKCPETSLDHRTKEVRNLAVDHDHTTGKVRALLCSACNIAIGLLQENPETLQSAINYLNSFKENL